MSHSSEKAVTAAYREFGSAVVGVYGWSDSGKTHLLTRMIEELTDRGHTVITAKHTAHSIKAQNRDGRKDSERHYGSGAKATLFLNDAEGELRFSFRTIEEAMKLLATVPHDVVLVEGMKDAEWPKISVGDIEPREGTVLSYPATEFSEIMAYVEREIATARAYLLLPGIDCELCGHRCLEMAGLIAAKEKTFRDCDVLRKRGKNRVRVRVGGKEVDLGKKFMDDLFYNTITGMVKTLKGVGEGDIEITIRRDSDGDNED